MTDSAIIVTGISATVIYLVVVIYISLTLFGDNLVLYLTSLLLWLVVFKVVVNFTFRVIKPKLCDNGAQ